MQGLLKTKPNEDIAYVQLGPLNTKRSDEALMAYVLKTEYAAYKHKGRK